MTDARARVLGAKAAVKSCSACDSDMSTVGFNSILVCNLTTGLSGLSEYQFRKMPADSKGYVGNKTCNAPILTVLTQEISIF